MRIINFKNGLVFGFIASFAIFLYISLALGYFGKVRIDYDKECEMTYMWPYFRPVTFPAGLDSKYRTYLYREDGLQDLEKKPNGVPILFIPGHGGSYKQVRSIASEAARMASKYSTELDFFTVDLNEEFSAIHGPSIMQQAEYIEKLVKHIYNVLYNGKIEIHVIGHSMGGIVASCLFTLPNFPVGHITSIFMYATPFISSPAPITHEIYDIYAKVHKSYQRDESLANISILSLISGIRDLTVNSEFSIIPGGIPFTLSIFTSEIPYVWGTCDHQGIIWCHQVVRLTAKIIYNSYDQKRKAWKSLEDRKQVYAKHLLPFEDPFQVSLPPQGVLEIDAGKVQEMILEKGEIATIFSNQWFGYNLRLLYRLRGSATSSEYIADTSSGPFRVKIIPGPMISRRRSHLTLLSIDGSLIEWISLGYLSVGNLNASITNQLGEYEYCTGYINNWNKAPLHASLPKSMAFVYISKGIKEINPKDNFIHVHAKDHFATRITLPNLKSSIFDSVILHFTFDTIRISDKFVTIETVSGALGEQKYFVNSLSDFTLHHSFHGDQFLYPMDISSRPVVSTQGVVLTVYHPLNISFVVQISPDYLAIPMQLLKRFTMIPLVVSFSMYIMAISKFTKTNSPTKALFSAVFDLRFHIIVLIVPCWWYGMAFLLMYFMSFGFFFLNTAFWLFFVLKPLRWLFAPATTKAQPPMRLFRTLFSWMIVLILTPHQYSFIFSFMYLLMTCIRYPHPNEILWFLVYTIPLYMNGAGLMVWIKNILINYFTFEGQDLLPSALLVFHVVLMRKYRNPFPCSPRFAWMTLIFCAYIVAFGGARPWIMYHGLAYFTCLTICLQAINPKPFY